MEGVSRERLAVEKFCRGGGKKAKMTLEILGKLQPFVEALSSKIGRELMEDLLLEVERNLEEIALRKGYEKPEVIARFEVSKALATRWAEKIALYNKKNAQVLGLSEGEGER